MKTFLKRTTCFLLILLMAIICTTPMCFSSTYGGSSEFYKLLVPKPILFNNKEEKKCVIKLYNKIRESFNGREIYDGNDFLSSDLIALYECINDGRGGMDFSMAMSSLSFLRYLANKNKIFVAD